MVIKEYHLKAGYTSVFEGIPEAIIELMPLQGVCTKVFKITIEDTLAEKYQLSKRTHPYLAQGIASFEFIPSNSNGNKSNSL